MASGDQAIMSEDGIIDVMGRYKDLIIRGGENIFPATIEMVLNKNEGVNLQVVGVPDEVAGEVPVAVIKIIGEISKEILFQQIVHVLGARYSLKAIIHLRDDLGLDNYSLLPLENQRKRRLPLLPVSMLRKNQGNRMILKMAQLLLDWLAFGPVFRGIRWTY